jgi:phenylpyruvate tautomerase PptA (4-oxalocrotonate tautomerase family)
LSIVQFSFFVIIDETKEGDWGIGGKAVNADMVAEHAKKALGG